LSKLKIPDLKFIDDPNSSYKFDIKYKIGDMRNGFPVLPKSKRKKILLLSDDIRLFTGIATQSKTLVSSTIHQFNWVNLGHSIDKQGIGKVFNFDEQIMNELGVEDPSLNLYPNDSYGNPVRLRQMIEAEKPDAIMIFTDPRYWVWLFQMEYEIKNNYKIPIIYWNIWDSSPAPNFNKAYYQTCDLLLGISKQTYQINKTLLEENYYVEGDKIKQLDKPLVHYLPHGINSKTFYPIDETDEDYKNYIEYKNKVLSELNRDEDCFFIFWNNRNIRRKNPGDVILGYKAFCQKLPKEQADKCILFMNTEIVDVNGTDLMANYEALCPEYKIAFSNRKLSNRELNYLYNIADVFPSLASNEGFGLGSCEAIMSGTPVILNVTGGLQDQLGFKDETGKYLQLEHLNDEWLTNSIGTYKKHGEWGTPLFPKVRTIKGHPDTPYIFDDFSDYIQLSEALIDWYKMGREERKQRGKLGREFLLTNGFNDEAIGNQFMSVAGILFNKWVSPKRWSIEKVKKINKKTSGINI
jgi:glycosyltransferase involved in cell wall biosynthesis